MTDHKGLPVPGYAPTQSDQAVNAVSANKQDEEKLLRLIDELQNGQLQGEAFNADPRWLALAKTHLEMGFMFLNRSIFKPDRVALPGDAD